MSKKHLSRVLVVSVILSICLSCLAGCTTKETDNKGGGGSVLWYLPIGTRPDDAVVYGEAANYIKDKIDVDLTINTIDSGNYEKKMQIINASNDKYDICFTSNWLNNYYTNIQNELLLPLDDLLKEEAPKLYELFDEKVWDGVRANGKIYGIMNQQIFARSSALFLPQQNLDETGFKADDFKTLSDLTPYLKKVHDITGQPARVPTTWQAYVSAAGLEEIVGSGLPGAVYYKQDDLKVVNQFATPEFEEFIRLVRSWCEAGYQHEEIITDLGSSAKTTLSDPIAAYAFHLPATYAPGTKEQMEAQYKCELAYAPLSKPLMTSYGVTATLQSINAMSENPVGAIRVLELVNTDKTLYNLLVHGVEGKNYTLDDDGRVVPSEDHPYEVADWAIGNTFNRILTVRDIHDLHEQTEAINDEAEFSPLYGFYPDLSNTSVQLSNCKSVIAEYLQGLEQGIADVDTSYPTFLEKLSAAGVDDIIAELQQQVDTWRTAQ